MRFYRSLRSLQNDNAWVYFVRSRMTHGRARRRISLKNIETPLRAPQPSANFPYKNKKSLLQREIPPAKETLFRTKTRGTTLLTRELLYQTFLLLSTKRTEVFIRQCRECSPHFLSINTKTTNPNPTSLSYLTKNLSAKPRFIVGRGFTPMSKT